MNTIESFKVLATFKRYETISNTMFGIVTLVFISWRQVDN